MIGVRAQDSRFRPYWWGTSLTEAGIDARPDVGTYGRYEFGDLPPVPFELRGELDWLAKQPAHDEWTINGNATSRLLELLAQCRRAGVPLPAEFTQFMATSTLQDRVRSNTACFLDLAHAPAPLPGGGGHLVRFLADQQGCLYWYLHVTGDGADHAVVCSGDFYDGADDEAAQPDPEQISFCAESFEAFLCRFWLENEIWFAATGKGSMPDVGAQYIDLYRERAADS
ncbi:hypothetical protein K1W54_15705 [Micromonospora sp. CPCC 205371]|nr:hypothetical protein [Micromonospora sp. CPCC 205371]